MGLKKIKGVSGSNVDLSSKVTTVLYHKEKTDVASIEKAISAIGYQANTVAADPVAYEALPACCKIGGMEKCDLLFLNLLQIIKVLSVVMKLCNFS